MSTLQSGLGGTWTDDGFEWPAWLDGYDDPVVRSSTTSRKRMHAPDLCADEVRPACPQGKRSADMMFVVAESEHLDGFYSECRHPECEQWFAGEGDR